MHHIKIESGKSFSSRHVGVIAVNYREKAEKAARLNFSKEKLWRALSFFGLNEYNLPIAETLAGKDFLDYYINNAWDSYILTLFALS